MKMIMGDKSLFFMEGQRAKSFRHILMAFLGPEAMRRYVARASSIAQAHIEKFWLDGSEVRAYLLVKKALFSVVFNLFLSIQNEEEEKELLVPFEEFLHGLVELPINFPGTKFRRAKLATRKIFGKLDKFISKRKVELQEGRASAEQDLLSVLLTTRGEDGERTPGKLRLVPPVLGNTRIAITQMTIEGFTVPKDWRFMWSVFRSNRRSAFFPDPDKFDPERFDGSSGLIPYTYVPFGGGPRICPGNEFAKMLLRVFLHHLLTQFQWALLDPNEHSIRTSGQRPPRQTVQKSNIIPREVPWILETINYITRSWNHSITLYHHFYNVLPRIKHVACIFLVEASGS
ncbi:cytochrome P450 716B1 [Selaginella moellendorffii]|uniref:cytochrome P450 716B1 n=1 Tax=Selaginella moellendorffii TaxID=88036 RepID=UPI000D1C68C8|nr:cytochrome P450 716B1 [Selaginella moellendorffii]|eukprot:XP_024544027.1 cytochrome P450 716B1 [Selaginella moellendorffii]